MTEIERCQCPVGCDYRLDGYAPSETICGACLDNCVPNLYLAEVRSVEFEAQEWVDDSALPIDPSGPTVWEPSDLVVLLEWYEDKKDALRYARWFDHDPNCPQWIRDHNGPFCIRVVSTHVPAD